MAQWKSSAYTRQQIATQSLLVLSPFPNSNSFLFRRYFRLVLLCVLVFGAGCASEPRFTSLPPDGTILAFGDSLTAGNEDYVSSSYPAQLEAMIGRKVINAGIPGELSAEGLERISRVLDETNPSLVIILHGGNDLLQGNDEQTIYENLKAMIASAKSRNIQVLLIGVPRPSLLLGGDAPLYEKVARDTGVPYFRNALKDILSNGALKADLIHPNAEGNRRLADGVAKFLRERGI